MVKEGAMKIGDILMLWGVIFTMMGILSIIQMGIMEHLSGFVLTGLIFMGVGICFFIGIILADKKKIREQNH